MGRSALGGARGCLDAQGRRSRESHVHATRASAGWDLTATGSFK